MVKHGGLLRKEARSPAPEEERPAVGGRVATAKASRCQAIVGERGLAPQRGRVAPEMPVRAIPLPAQAAR